MARVLGASIAVPVVPTQGPNSSHASPSWIPESYLQFWKPSTPERPDRSSKTGSVRRPVALSGKTRSSRTQSWEGGSGLMFHFTPAPLSLRFPSSFCPYRTRQRFLYESRLLRSKSDDHASMTTETGTRHFDTLRKPNVTKAATVLHLDLSHTADDMATPYRAMACESFSQVAGVKLVIICPVAGDLEDSARDSTASSMSRAKPRDAGGDDSASRHLNKDSGKRS